MRKHGTIFMSSKTTFFLYAYIFYMYVSKKVLASSLWSGYLFYLHRSSDDIGLILPPDSGVCNLSANTQCRSLTNNLNCVQHFRLRLQSGVRCNPRHGTASLSSRLVHVASYLFRCGLSCLTYCVVHEYCSKTN